MHWLGISPLDFSRSIATLIAAPILYFLVGLPWSILSRRLAWAPLWGIAVFGISGELAFIIGVPVPAALAVVGGIHLAVAAALLLKSAERARASRSALGGFSNCYAIALCPLVAAPFAIPGSWGGDWAVALGGGEAILHGMRFTSELLARPPLFGAASIPLLLLAPTMAGFQVFCAVASACALQTFRSGLRPETDRMLVWVLAGSVFFLQITANAWPKFLCAAFLLAAWQALGTKEAHRLAWGGILLGFAIATHQSAILFAPLALTRLRRSDRRIALGQMFAVLGLAALIAGLWEIHTLIAYGWEAKLHANPAVSARLGPTPPGLSALLVGVTTLIAWGPLHVLRHWLFSPDRFTSFRAEHEVYWGATSLFNCLAGSLAGLACPWWLALGWRELSRRMRKLWCGLDGPVRVSLGLALAGQMLLTPFYSIDGSLQAGWVPGGIALALWFATEMAQASPQLRGRALGRIGLFSAGPWFAFNLALTAALVLSRGFRTAFYDSDLETLDQHHWVSLAMGGFPWVQILAGIWVWFAWFKARPVRIDSAICRI
jgi:hypothetical protein